MNMVVCSDNATKYEHVVLTCFAHSQLFFFLTVAGIHTFLLQITSLRQ